METICWTVDMNKDLSRSYPQITQAANLLKQNEVVAFPTETVYGLGANALSDEAVGKIYQAKGRPSDNPLIVHISSLEQLKELSKDIPLYAQKLMNVFWPGPITFVFFKKGRLSNKVTAGLETVAVRMPDHPLALELIKQSNLPLAAPSANLSGKPSPTAADHVFEDLQGKIAGIVDGGRTGVGVESTVLDCTGEVPIILRPGGITKEQIEEVVGAVEADQALINEAFTPKSPGMKYAHYSPEAPLTIIEGDTIFFQKLIDEARLNGKRVGVLTTEEQKHFYKADLIIACGSRSQLDTVAQQLYDALRKFNEQQLDCIYSESFPSEGMGQAVMNRLLKAAGHRVISQG
ncbi:L-threonylcarbamoyladenylate synthase [Metabacillus arenae]|uniref:Threonylcarbamoyl-AMP synthase n=1 Tax=Metabacillus arenae TaxID=2771434 RepID=A0A926NMJ7_9BACI|nr:L-threonylcarbamoyladenylate synthase [Metabacillus arenae]MBD1383460.1 threonylcarbamoyl-AMP synthase [Metabacillus arenae]